jgi:hypothetical protein
MTDPSKAVFLSYASQDAEPARRICEALRAAGIEVWFDQSELRGGDTWDALIRQQIKACYLFVPMISANTQSREEGYFRREWKLAVDRTNDMAGGRARSHNLMPRTTIGCAPHVVDQRWAWRCSISSTARSDAGRRERKPWARYRPGRSGFLVRQILF